MAVEALENQPARRRWSETERGYGAEHQQPEKAAIRAQPWCSVCGHPGSRDNPLTGDRPRVAR
jgi:hypothetical protein